MSISQANSAPAVAGEGVLRLPLERVERRSAWRWLAEVGWTLPAIALTVGFGWLVFSYFAPGNSGVDQNGYLVGGRMLWHHGSMHLDMTNPDGKPDYFRFVGRMWVCIDPMTENERYFPKYPIGLPLIYASLLWLLGPQSGVAAAFYVSPICVIAAVAFSYLLMRQFMHPLLAVAGAAVVAFNPVTLAISINPNSHASTLMLVTGGMMLLAWWMMRGGAAIGLMAGLMLGAAATIRYTEALLVLPVLFAIALRWRPWRLRTYAQPLMLGLGFALPIAALLLHNLVEMNSLTGYDPTNESTGFRYEYFEVNWLTFIDLMQRGGMIFVFPVGAIGLFCMLFWHWRLATLMLLWAIPGITIYLFYYWAPDGQTLGYMRFFLTIFPPLAVGAFGMLQMAADTGSQAVPWRLRFGRGLGAATAALVLAGGTAAMGAYRALPEMERLHVNGVNLADRAAKLNETVPAGSVVFCDDTNLGHYLQFTSDIILYGSDVISAQWLRRGPRLDSDDPNPLDPNRRRSLEFRLGSLNDRALERYRQQVIDDALTRGQRVFIINSGGTGTQLRRALDTRRLTTTRVLSATDPAVMSPTTPRTARIGGMPMRPPGGGRFPAGPGQPPQARVWEIWEIVPTGRAAGPSAADPGT